MNKDTSRETRIVHVTAKGTIVNIVLVALKFAAAILGRSAAMLADAVHSITDLATDLIVIAFVKLGGRPKDKSHPYGHGKIETMASLIVGLILAFVGMMILYNGLCETISAIQGVKLERPGVIALIAAIASVILKEWAYRFTISEARSTQSQALYANAWHHRSDAFSSIGTSIGIAGAIFLGERWRVLDPITAIIVSLFILRVSYLIVSQSVNELLEGSLSQEIEDDIANIATKEPCVKSVHAIMTRRIGKNIAVEMHVNVPGNLSVSDAHTHATNIENKIKEIYGKDCHVGIHIEPSEEEDNEHE